MTQSIEEPKSEVPAEFWRELLLESVESNIKKDKELEELKKENEKLKKENEKLKKIFEEAADYLLEHDFYYSTVNRGWMCEGDEYEGNDPDEDAEPEDITILFPQYCGCSEERLAR